MKLFLDANVVFSAANEASNLHRFVLELAERHALVTSFYAQHEAFRNILAKRPQWETGFVSVTVLTPLMLCKAAKKWMAKKRANKVPVIPARDKIATPKQVKELSDQEEI